MWQDATDWCSPKLEVRDHPHKGGKALFAIAAVGEGELLTIWSGRIATSAQLAALTPEERRYSVQVEEDLYLVTMGPLGPTDYMNHSCEPNAGLSGQIALRAMRDIEAGEEVCFDYAMSDGTPYDEFPCGCGAPGCRGLVTGSDWRMPELQQRYEGWFSPYLTRRIRALAGAAV